MSTAPNTLASSSLSRLRSTPAGELSTQGFSTPAAGSRLAHLRAKAPKPGEASFFFYEAHFKSDAVKVLPEGIGDSGRYGSYAMELLINELLKRGPTRSGLEAKVFGGGAVLSGMSSLNVGERNTRFVLDYLKTEHITVVSKDVMDICPRKVCFLPASGKAMVKRLASSSSDALVA